MWCALVFYFGVTIFGVVYSLPEPCVFKDYDGKKHAFCGRHDVKYTLDFIPSISQDISYINMRGQSLQQLQNNGFRNLSSQKNISEIRLTYCQISHVDAGALLNLHNLILIDLSHNDINQIDSQLFSDTKQIEYIYMEYIKIEVVPSGLFQNLIQLKMVLLDQNRIHRVERFSFKNTPSLLIIDLSNNQIEFMNLSFKDKFDNLTRLRLDGNPWKCNCELGPLYEFLTKNNMLNLYVPVKCENPSTLHGRYWSDISRDIFVCRSEVTMSTIDSVMTTEQDDYMPVTVHNGTRNQQVDTAIPQPSSYQNWIPWTISILVLVGVAAVIIGRLTHARHVDSGIPMRDVHNSAMSADSDSGSSTADVDEDQTSIHHDEIREATIS